MIIRLDILTWLVADSLVNSLIVYTSSALEIPRRVILCIEDRLVWLLSFGIKRDEPEALGGKG